MTLDVGVVAAGLAIVVSVAYCAALASGPVYGAVDRRLATLPAATRASLLLAWATAPLMIGLVALLLVFAPSLAHLLGVGTDHCHAHGHHAHLCLVHTPFFTGGLLEQMILGGTGVAVLGHVLTVGWRFGRGRRAVRTLLALGEASAATAPYRIVDSQLPFAVTAGLLRPRVFVSNRLFHDLSPSELATVLRHEQAHQRRRDGTRFFTAEVFSALHLRPTRRRILDALGAWPFAGLIVAAGLATSEWWHHSAETLFAFWLG